MKKLLISSKLFVSLMSTINFSSLRLDNFLTLVSKELWGRPTTTADFRSSFWQIPHASNTCTCSQFPTEAMLWTKEAEMVESVDDLKSSRSIRGTPEPNFELLDARNGSALNKIIQNTRFKKKVSLEEMKAHKEDRFLRGRQIANLMYILPGHWSPMILSRIMPTYLQSFFEIMIFRNSIQNGTKLLLLMTPIPSDDILESLYKLRIRESEKLKTVLELVQYGDSSEESFTWLSQIEDNGKEKYRAEFANEEFWSQKRKLWDKRRGQESGDKTAWTKKSWRLLAMES